MKILWISEFKVPTGFARVSKALVGKLNKVHDITVLDWYESKKSFDTGVHVIGKKDEKDDLGVKAMLEVYQNFDAIYILNDVWNIDKYLAALKKVSVHVPLPKIVIYFPVDATMHNPSWYENFDIVTHAVTYTKFAVDVILQAAPQLKDKIKIIPHGIDTDTFYKSPIPKSEIREYLYGSKAFNDAFIFFSANRNALRKKLDITIRAFAEFIKRSGAKDAYLHLHCGLKDFGIHIPTVIKQFGIDDRIIVSNQESSMQNISSDLLNLYYNATNVGVNASLGEGWSLTNMEHAMSGAIQIVPNHSAPAELFEGRGVLANIAGEVLIDHCYTLGQLVDYKHLAQCMEACYGQFKASSVAFMDGEKAREYFSQRQFSWTTIAGQWETLFKN